MIFKARFFHVFHWIYIVSRRGSGVHSERNWGLHTPRRSIWSGKFSKVLTGGFLRFNVLEIIQEAICHGTHFIRLIDLMSRLSDEAIYSTCKCLVPSNVLMLCNNGFGWAPGLRLESPIRIHRAPILVTAIVSIQSGSILLLWSFVFLFHKPTTSCFSLFSRAVNGMDPQTQPGVRRISELVTMRKQLLDSDSR